MDRRNFIQLINAGSAATLFLPHLACSGSGFSKEVDFERILLRAVNYSPMSLPKNKRVAFGWPAIGVAPKESVYFKPDTKIPDGNLWLRFSVAQEIRDKKLLHVQLSDTGDNLGSVDIRFSSVLVPYEVKIDEKYISEINRQGVKITLESPSSFWFFSQPASDVDNKAFLPQFISSQNKRGSVDNFLNCFISVNSVQSFGWREGTVLDGLWQLYSKMKKTKALDAIHKHFDLFFDDHRNLIYENARSEQNDNRVDGIESTIPFATLARIYPEHPILKIVTDGWKNLEKEGGMVIDGSTVSAEGCYTVAYPMAVIGKAWNNKALMKNALAQLKHRFVLINDNKIYLRYNTNGTYTYPNWARGAAWVLLGFVRTIAELNDEFQDDEIVGKFREAVEIALSMQRENGLWGCFMHEPKSLPDTSGSAGICAAILTGINNGYLPETYRPGTEKCWAALQNYLTPDGFLKGVAQDNRGGIELQRSDYRVIAQMGMGMMAQLYAELK